MKHHLRQDQLFTLHDGELTGAARREAEAHLADCAVCRKTLAQWQRTANALFRAPDVHPSDAFVHQLMERIKALEQPRRAAPWVVAIRWLAPAVGLAGLLLLVLGPMERAVSVETLLLTEAREQAPTQFVLASEPSTMDDVLGSIMEGQP